MIEFEQRPVTLIKAEIAQKTTSSRDVTLLLSKDSVDRLGQGNEASSVRRVTIPYGSRMTKGLAYKEYIIDYDATYALLIYTRLKKEGLPVPPTFRLVKEDDLYKGILMTDLTKDWQDIFISSNDTKRYMLTQVAARSPETLRAFTDLNVRDAAFMDSFYKKLVVIAKKAAVSGIRFNAGDVIGATFSKESELCPIISDMGNISIDRKTSYKTLYDKNVEAVGHLRGFVSNAHSIARGLI